MDDERFVSAFEALELGPGEFAHADHVRLAWIYLGQLPLLEAIGRYREGLKRFASHVGAHDLYHETVTWAFLILINERVRLGPPAETWLEFAERNPDLLRWKDGAFFEHYPPEILESELARSVFVLPPRRGLPEVGRATEVVP